MNAITLLFKYFITIQVLDKPKKAHFSKPMIRKL